MVIRSLISSLGGTIGFIGAALLAQFAALWMYSMAFTTVPEVIPAWWKLSVVAGVAGAIMLGAATRSRAVR